MRTIAFVTTSRADYSYYRPILSAIAGARAVLLVSGGHLSRDHGYSIEEIKKDGYEIADEIPVDLSDDSPVGIACSTATVVAGFARAFDRLTPDVMVVLGDRFEMHAAALAAVPAVIPIAHVHGGELTMGAIDDALRHSLTKLSHLHFVSTEEYARRVHQMGEEDWRIVVSGAPSLDNIEGLNLLSARELEDDLELSLGDGAVVVTYHPVTLDVSHVEEEVDQLTSALERTERSVVVTGPNADTSNKIIDMKLKAFARSRDSVVFVENLGPLRYYSLLAQADAMVGNSSSGIIEAPSFELPVVNIGSRQEGRVRASNVIDVACRAEDITMGLNKALSADFRKGLRGLVNPYKRGGSARIIAERLVGVDLTDRVTHKRFVDLPVTARDRDR